MPVIKFGYDKFGLLHGLAFIVIAIVSLLFFMLNPKSDFSGTFIIMVILVITYATYRIIKPLISTMKGKSALIIDEKKIFITDKNETVYWKEVLSIDEKHNPFTRTTYIIFRLIDNKSVEFDPRNLNADYSKVLNTLQNYFKGI